MGKALVTPIPAPATPQELLTFVAELDRAAAWVQAPVTGAVPFLTDVVAAGGTVAEVAVVDADPPVALLGVAVIVLIFGAGLFIRALGELFAVLPWPLNHLANSLLSAGNRVIQYGIDVVLFMVRPLIQLAVSLWRGLDKLLGLGLATAAQLAIAIYKHIHVIGPHQIAANDTGIAQAAAAAVNAIVGIAPDYEMKAVKAGHKDIAALMRTIPHVVPSTAAGAVTALATAVRANTQVTDECALPWCDTIETAGNIAKDLRGLLGGLLGAALFCTLVDDPAGAAGAIARDSGAFLAGLGAGMVAAGDPAGALYSGLLDVVINDPAGAAGFLSRVVCR